MPVASQECNRVRRKREIFTAGKCDGWGELVIVAYDGGTKRGVLEGVDGDMLFIRRIMTTRQAQHFTLRLAADCTLVSRTPPKRHRA